MRPALFNKSINKTLKLSFFIVLTISLGYPMTSGAQSQSMPGEIAIEQGGQLWIEGSAGPVDYQCNAEELSGKGEITNRSNPQSVVTNEGDVQVSVILPVKSLNCGKSGMNRDMYEALKATKHPTISYQLLDASAVSSDQNSSDSVSENHDNGWMDIRTHGIMQIAGVKDTTTITVQGRVLENNKFRVKGVKKLHMDTYNIDPPSKMFGLIKAKKDLTVHFDVTVTLWNQALSELTINGLLR